MKNLRLSILVVITSLFSTPFLFAQTGAQELFDDGVTTGWTENSYVLNESGGEMSVSVTNVGAYAVFDYQLPQVLDVSSSSYINLKIRTTNEFYLRVDFIDTNGYITNASPVGSLINNSGNYTEYFFDFSNKFSQSWPSSQTVNPEAISEIVFFFNPGQTGYTGTAFFDSLLIGSEAPTPPPIGEGIKVNQIGYYPDGERMAIVSGGDTNVFHVISTATQDTAFSGNLSAGATWSYSGEFVKIADFSVLTSEGEYQVVVPGFTSSYEFEIKENVLGDVAKGSIKAYYYMRASMELESEYAGQWARNAGHPGDNVLVHNSAASTGRPTGTSIACPKGWYDAGDYNLYVVNAGISTYTLLSSYEQFGAYYDTVDLNIPESNNVIPDILDEALYNLRWMMCMQDPFDGGVYHKLTSANFSGSVMPENDNNTRYVVQKGTAATLDFAAVMAQAARVLAHFETELPGLADSCLTAAIDAWEWALANPNIAYNQSSLISPEISTGEYGDNNFSDEFDWAGSELFITTGDIAYANETNALGATMTNVPSWPNVRPLGIISLIHFRTKLPSGVDTTALKNRLIGVANALVNEYQTSEYRVSMGRYSWDFVWGSNGTAGNQGLILINAFNATGDSTYLNAAMASMDYLLGRNATNYSFMTGYGDNTPMDPHHRPSVADGIEEPIPGLLAGGPHDGQQDGCTYPSDMPALSYSETYCSYATNEITINWNAPLVYLSGSIEALKSGIKSEAKDILTTVVTGVEDDYKISEVTIFPVPSKDKITIKYTSEGASEITIHDIMGKEILSKDVNDIGQIEEAFNIENLNEGIYFIRIESDGMNYTIKFIKN